jgi:hypothetical protein
MPRGVKKENLPIKVCVICSRPFNWRKKWERCWDEVTTCSKACNAARRQLKGTASVHAESDSADDDSAETVGTHAVDEAGVAKQQRKAAAKAAKAIVRAKRECNAPADCSCAARRMRPRHGAWFAASAGRLRAEGRWTATQGILTTGMGDCGRTEKQWLVPEEV